MSNVSKIHGKGLMRIECTHEVASFIEQPENRDVLAGPNVIRLLPPLIVTNEELKQAVYMIKSSCTKRINYIGEFSCQLYKYRN